MSRFLERCSCVTKLNEAQAFFKHTIQLHTQAHDAFGEANDVQKLGEVQLQQNKLDEAQVSFKKALTLYQQAHSVLGEANSNQSLGCLYLQQDNLQEAELCLNHALHLYQKFQTPLRQATDLGLLPSLPVCKQLSLT